MLSFAFKTLVSDRGKLLTGLAGVVFSLVLINVQGGLYLGLMRKARLLIDHDDADLWVGHRGVENVNQARDIPELWINRIRGLPDVESAQPYIVGKGTASLAGGRIEDVWILGSDAIATSPSTVDFAEGTAADLQRPDAVSFDEVDFERLGRPHVGDRLEINGHRARFLATTRGITGFITMPHLFTTFETARRLSNIAPGACSFFLVKVREGADIAAVQASIQKRIPYGSVYTPREFASLSQDYWMKRMGIGISFGASTLLGLLVGLMMVGQSLYALALDHLQDYATLKALGAEDSHVCRVIVFQSLSIAGIGSLAGVLIVAVIRKFWHSPLAPVEIPFTLIGSAVALVFIFCLVASLLPYLRIRRIDTASVLA